MRPPIGSLLETAARLGVLDAALDSLWRLVQGDPEAARSTAENGAKKAAAKLALEEIARRR